MCFVRQERVQRVWTILKTVSLLYHKPTWFQSFCSSPCSLYSFFYVISMLKYEMLVTGFKKCWFSFSHCHQTFLHMTQCDYTVLISSHHLLGITQHTRHKNFLCIVYCTYRTQQTLKIYCSLCVEKVGKGTEEELCGASRVCYWLHINREEDLLVSDYWCFVVTGWLFRMEDTQQLPWNY
jgi:hypothetical protein